MPRYGSADSQERQIQAGKKQSGTTTVNPRDKFTKVMDEYGQATPIWKWTDPATQAAIQGTANYYGQGGQPSGQGKWSDINTMRLGIIQSGGVTPQSSSSGGSGGPGYGQLLSALQQYASNIPDNSQSIRSGYADLIKSITDRSTQQDDLIKSLFGEQTSQLERSNTDMLSQLANMYTQATGEVDRQTAEGRQTIDDTTQRALEALQVQQNPYAGLQMLAAPSVTDPMAAYSQAVGAPAEGVNALQNMLQSQNAATGNAFNNLAQLLGASQSAAQQSRIGDVNVARAGAQQDLGANQRAVALQLLNQRNQQEMAQRARFDEQKLGLGQNILQARLGTSGQLNDILNSLGSQQLQTLLQERQGQQATRASLQDQLLALAAKGVDVSKLMASLGGVR